MGWKKSCFKKNLPSNQSANIDTDAAAQTHLLRPRLTFSCLILSSLLPLPPPLCPSHLLQLPQQFQFSVWTTWNRTTTIIGHQCLAPLAPHLSPRAPAAPAPLPVGRQAPCCRTVWGRTAGTMGPGPPRAVQERLWSAATPALSSCPRLPWTKPPWMTARGPSPAPPNPVTPCSGKDTPLHPTHPQSETALPGALPMQSGPSPIERNLDKRIDDSIACVIGWENKTDGWMNGLSNPAT